MITDYNRGNGSGGSGGDSGDDGDGSGVLKALGGNMKKWSSSYASSKSMIDLSSLQDFSKDAIDLTNQSYTGGIDIGEVGKFMAGSLGGISAGKKSKEKSSNFFKDLIDLIIGIITIPKRFPDMLQASLRSVEMLALGITGLTQSAALGISDIALLFYSILQLIVKYGLCILSFIITLAPCFIIHIITALCYVVYYWLVYTPVSGIDRVLGTNSIKMVDKSLSYISWPKTINMLCYTCFGKQVKLADIMDDVSVVTEIGDKMSFDFNKRIPRYLRPATPAAKAVKRHLEAAFR